MGDLNYSIWEACCATMVLRTAKCVVQKKGTSKGETRNIVMQGRRATGQLHSVTKGRTLHVEVKKDLRNSNILPTRTCKV